MLSLFSISAIFGFRSCMCVCWGFVRFVGVVEVRRVFWRFVGVVEVIKVVSTGFKARVSV